MTVKTIALCLAASLCTGGLMLGGCGAAHQAKGNKKEVRFKKITLTNDFVAEGVTV